MAMVWETYQCFFSPTPTAYGSVEKLAKSICHCWVLPFMWFSVSDLVLCLRDSQPGKYPSDLADTGPSRRAATFEVARRPRQVTSRGNLKGCGSTQHSNLGIELQRTMHSLSVYLKELSDIWIKTAEEMDVPDLVVSYDQMLVSILSISYISVCLSRIRCRIYLLFLINNIAIRRRIR